MRRLEISDGSGKFPTTPLMDTSADTRPPESRQSKATAAFGMWPGHFGQSWVAAAGADIKPSTPQACRPQATGQRNHNQ